ncbi:similar to Kazachstania africana KAFR0K00135 hypothetical protein [Maudiozyma saulgeensis]|uniref:Uncharacterized protein n=1 Tax=Maudiozyma saulgeensis TaxID=1789683 RepID=A0A1X7RAP8_9SACH|nr:similar to Kazachstania africana KAFR0K00135 hypothetical protein [Kazachstania saulgeensis]
MSGEISMKQWNKYFAYSGDVANYNIEYGDFEYAKHGALVSASFAAMVLKNDEKFPKSVCKSAVSNMLINGVVNEYFLEKYTPFWLFGYSIVNIQDDRSSVYSIYCKLHYSALLASCLLDGGSYEKFQRSNGIRLFDIDVARFALHLGRMDIFEDQLNLAKKHGKFWKHLDFEKEEQNNWGYSTVLIEDVYEPFPDHHPLLNYEELSVTDILNSTTEN